MSATDNVPFDLDDYYDVLRAVKRAICEGNCGKGVPQDCGAVLAHMWEVAKQNEGQKAKVEVKSVEAKTPRK